MFGVIYTYCKCNFMIHATLYQLACCKILPSLHGLQYIALIYLQAENTLRAQHSICFSKYMYAFLRIIDDISDEFPGVFAPYHTVYSCHGSPGGQAVALTCSISN